MTLSRALSQKLLILKTPEFAYYLRGIFVIFLNIYTALWHLPKAESGQTFTGGTLFRAPFQKLLTLLEHRWQVMLGRCMADHVWKFRPHLTTCVPPTAESVQNMYWVNPIPGSSPKSTDPKLIKLAYYLFGFIADFLVYLPSRYSFSGSGRVCIHTNKQTNKPPL